VQETLFNVDFGQMRRTLALVEQVAGLADVAVHRRRHLRTMRLECRHNSPDKDRRFPFKLPKNGADISKYIVAMGGKTMFLQAALLCMDTP
jgi:hypothetical protein